MNLSLTQLEEKKSQCGGCRNNFYNHGDHSKDNHCWSLEGAKLVWRWRINMWTPMDKKSNFHKVQVYHCYHGEGNQRDIYMERLPQHLGGDYASPANEGGEHGN